jgi:hypothetical protein
MSDIVERLDDLWEKVSDVDSITVLYAKQEIVKLRALLREVFQTIDQGRMVEKSSGGMSIESQILRSVYNGVPAWPIEKAREIFLYGESDE